MRPWRFVCACWAATDVAAEGYALFDGRESSLGPMA